MSTLPSHGSQDMLLLHQKTKSSTQIWVRGKKYPFIFSHQRKAYLIEHEQNYDNNNNKTRSTFERLGHQVLRIKVGESVWRESSNKPQALKYKSHASNRKQSLSHQSNPNSAFRALTCCSTALAALFTTDPSCSPLSTLLSSASTSPFTVFSSFAMEDGY